MVNADEKEKPPLRSAMRRPKTALEKDKSPAREQAALSKDGKYNKDKPRSALRLELATAREEREREERERKRRQRAERLGTTAESQILRYG